MILNAIGIMIILYSLLNYKKGFLLYLVYQIFWFYGATLFSIGGKTITASMGMTLVFFVMYFLNSYRYPKPHTRLPYAIPLIAITISLIITCFVAFAGLNQELTRAISNIIQDVLIVWLIWNLVETKKDFEFLFKGFTLVILLACLYGTFEYASHMNPIFDLKNSISTNHISSYTEFTGTAADRGYRLTSFFEHPIGAGMSLGLYASFVLTIVVKCKKKIPYEKLALITVLLCVPCIVLTKMRSTMLFTMISGFSFIDFRKKKFYKIILFIAIGIAIAWPIISQNLTLFLSIFNKKLQSSVGGSSFEMRLTQLDAVQQLLKLSPIGGLGELFKGYISNQYTEAALSYESIWFEQMVKHGMIGVIANIILAYYSVIKVPKDYHSKEIFFISLAYWITYTATSIPSFRMHMYYLVLFYFIKTSETYKNSLPIKKRISLKIGIR